MLMSLMSAAKRQASVLSPASTRWISAWRNAYRRAAGSADAGQVASFCASVS